MKIKINKNKLRKISPSDNYFLSLARAVIYQQISTKAGDAIYAKFLALFEGRKPTPQAFLNFNISWRLLHPNISRFKLIV